MGRKKPSPELIEPPEYPWDRQPGESKTAWYCFTLYRDFGAERSLAKVGKKLGKKAPWKIEVWSSKHNWVARTNAYDAWIDKQNRKADLEARLEMRKRHRDFAKTLQGLAALALNKMVAGERKTVKIRDPATGQDIEAPAPATLKPNEMKEIAALGLSEERKAIGEPDVVTETRGPVLPGSAVILNPDDYKDLSLDELRVLKAIVDRIGKPATDDGDA